MASWLLWRWRPVAALCPQDALVEAGELLEAVSKPEAEKRKAAGTERGGREPGVNNRGGSGWKAEDRYENTKERA